MSEYYLTKQDYLMHYGVLKMKWGVRRYQNPDGSLTPEGKIHYAELRGEYDRQVQKAKDIQSKIDIETKKHSSKIARLENKAAKLRKKETGLFTSKEKAAKLEEKARRAEIKANSLSSKTRKLQAKLDKVNAILRDYDTKLDSITPKDSPALQSLLKEFNNYAVNEIVLYGGDTSWDNFADYLEDKYYNQHNTSEETSKPKLDIDGMRWGAYKYRNEDGSLTPKGQKVYEKMTINGVEMDRNRPRYKELEDDGWNRDPDYDGEYYTKPIGKSKAKMTISSYSGIGDNPRSHEEIKDRMKTAKTVEDNFADFNKTAKNAALKDLSDNMLDNKDSQEKFIKSARLQTVEIHDRGGASFMYYGDNDVDDGLAGHMVTVEYDTKKKKPLYVSVNG